MKDIAIVGMACRYPDANTPKALWENVLTKRRAFRRLPTERLNLADYPEIYCNQAAVIEGYEFDRVKYKIAGSTYRSTDHSHWLALDVAAQALEDAGFPDGNGLSKSSTGVLVGNTLTGEFSRAALMRLRWPYVRRMVEAGLVQQDWNSDKIKSFMLDLEANYKQAFEPVGEETLAGGLSNTIAGRICNYFDFGGGGYTLDGACSSSLLAVANACRALITDEVDSVVVGGVDLSLDPFELVGFSAIGALASEEMRVYDAASNGFLPGEGCGFMVLMRYDDALACGARCYGLLKGWGISSDGSGGITRPEEKGQSLALKRAYQQAGYDIDTVALFEGHGTGTKVGDEVELKTLLAARNKNAAPAAIGSIKANIGHTKAAAGMAGLLKAVMAVHHQILPPTTGFKHPHSVLTNTNLSLLSKGEIWPSEQALRAGVSSFGFGGINVHLTIEAISHTRRSRLTPREHQLLTSPQDYELFLFGADDFASLAAQLQQLAAIAPRLSLSELIDLAASLTVEDNKVRAAIIAATPTQLAEKIKQLKAYIAAGTTQVFETDIFLYNSTGKISLLFPGQASPVRLNGGGFTQRFASIQALYERAQLANSDDKSTAVAQPAIITAEIAGLQLLDYFGIKAQLAIGHSLGELAALHWAGAMDETTLLELAKVRGRAMTDVGGSGAMLSIASADIMEGINVACYNSPNQTVVSGTVEEIKNLQASIKGLTTTLLPVSHGFHSKLMIPAAEVLEDYLGSVTLKPIQQRVISTITGSELAADTDLRSLLTRQLTDPVRFTQALELATQDTDLFIEVGPGQILTNLVTDVPVVSLDVANNSLQSLLNSLAAAYVVGSPIKHQALFADRLTRPFSLDWQPKFFANPCELAPSIEPVDTIEEEQQSENTIEILRTLIAKRAELPTNAVHNNSRLLADLHLNSISVGQIVAEVGRKKGLNAAADPTAYANASLEEIATAIEDRIASGEVKTEITADLVMGVDAWVRPFIVEQVATPLSGTIQPAKGDGGWQIFGDNKQLEQALNAWGGNGVALCLADQNDLAMILAAAKAALGQQYFILIQYSMGTAAFARSFYQEQTDITTVVITLPNDEHVVERVLAELEIAENYHEVYYDNNGIRHQRRLKNLTGFENLSGLKNLTGLILVTGGGKGITAECAASLATEYDVRLALLGRSKPENDPELAKNLARFKQMGINFKYFSVDVTDADAVTAIISELGPITALIHGAGTNKPTLIRDLDEDILKRTLAPKVDGLRNILSAIKDLRLLVNFGSVIATAGMPGEAHYALANERLANINHPNCRCLTLEWSVWSEVGMGRRLGSDEILSQQGITPISPDIGIAILHQALQQNWTQTVVVTGRMPTIPTMPLQRPELPFLRFLQPRVYYPGIELVTEVEISPTTDPYLNDHVFKGERLFPAVMALEAMAQVASAVLATDQIPSFENIEFSRPVIVEDTETLQIAALVQSSDKVDVVVRCAQTNFKIDHFRARCVFTKNSTSDLLDIEATDIIPAQELYGDLLFQTGRFQRISSYRHLEATQCIAEIANDDKQAWFGRYLPPNLILGDAGSRDAAIHAIQACIPHAQLLPVGVERLNFVDVTVNGPWIVTAKERWQKDDLFCYDLVLRGADGRLRETWEGLRLHKVSTIEWQTGWLESLLAPYVERSVQELIPKSSLHIHNNLNAKLVKRPDGKPQILNSDLKVSASHSNELSLTITGTQDLSCDVEPVIKRDIWTDLLGSHHNLVDIIYQETHENHDNAATRVWTARECLKKVGALLETPLTIKTATNNGWILFGAGNMTIASSVLTMKNTQQALALAVLVGT